MMTRDQLDQAQKLSRRIKLLEADLEEYRKAETFVVGLNKSKMGPGIFFLQTNTLSLRPSSAAPSSLWSSRKYKR
jgi:hypothetical protein